MCNCVSAHSAPHLAIQMFQANLVCISIIFHVVVVNVLRIVQFVCVWYLTGNSILCGVELILFTFNCYYSISLFRDQNTFTSNITNVM